MSQTPLSSIFERRSIRRYLPQAVPAGAINQLLNAAVWAPSAHNRQPWRMAVITGEETKHRLATVMGQRLRRDLAADGLAREAIDADAERSYRRITGAPLLILFCLTMSDMDVYPDQQRQHNEWVMAVQSVAMAGQNLLLAAHALGLGACWMCAPLFCADVVRETLGLASGWEPMGLVTVGYPAEARSKTREPLASRVIFLDD